MAENETLTAGEIAPAQAEADRDFEEFWRPLLSTDGVLDMAKVREELAVWHFVMGEVAKVYCHVTNGRLSKPNYYADALITVIDDIQSADQREALREAFDWIADELRRDIRAEEFADRVEVSLKERYCG